MDIHGYKIEIVEGPRHFIRLIGDMGRHQKMQCAWGRKAAKAIRDLAKLQAAEDDYQLKVWLTQKFCNGF